MGMYTELVCAFELDSQLPQQVINILSYMVGETDDDILDEYGIPDHPLFKTNRWDFMLTSDSYYFDGVTNSGLTIDYLIKDKPMYYLSIRCNLKNYDDEIEKFIDWIKPYIHTKGFIGYKRYEEDEHPELIYV